MKISLSYSWDFVDSGDSKPEFGRKIKTSKDKNIEGGKCRKIKMLKDDV
jgi:hypothetical protein